MKLKKYLYVDIDGTLKAIGSDNRNNTFFMAEFDKNCVKWLNYIIEQTDCELIISSDWRKCYAFTEIKKFFKYQGILKEPIDVTSMYEIYPKSTTFEEDIDNRLFQIDGHVQHHKPDRYAIIDDLGLWIRRKDFKEFVQIGLDTLEEETANKTIEILNAA